MTIRITDVEWQTLLAADLLFMESQNVASHAFEKVGREHIIAIIKWCQQLTPEIVDDIDKVAKSMDAKRKLYDGMLQHLTTLHKTAE